ncbi:VTT domain-containing protein [Microaerobacter geothermalis]|uniref:YqaA family protein n=1 Tax=Microaerobacter geothermalis TaxID=674972 RepID=UPI001F358063|nr:VTT domain-containing protein [Microaerobacter geothermalis]MCF6093029.1 VTT domain-containing protein [Microaerobacter geothermalis]
MLSEWATFFLSWGGLGLAIISFAEASFFPIPPDLLLIPLAIAAPEKAIWYGFITTLFSSLGAILGYYLGTHFGRPLLSRFAKPTTISRVEKMFRQYGALAVAIAGFTPIPYKVFTIAGGIFRVSPFSLLIGSVAGRGLRFFGEAIIILILGSKAESFINRYAGVGTIIIAVALILLYIFIRRKSIGWRL